MNFAVFPGCVYAVPASTLNILPIDGSDEKPVATPLADIPNTGYNLLTFPDISPKAK
jgi:hypothetical protein